jgi:DNA-directed RNA polymerase specialized sigma24 family protein
MVPLTKHRRFVTVVNIPPWNQDQWTEALERLALHAVWKMSSLYWRGIPMKAGGKAPGGIEPEDLAAEAIVDAIEGRRAWDAVKQPDYLAFLKGVIDSKINHAATKIENSRTRQLAPTADGKDPLEAIPDRAGSDPETIYADQEAGHRFRQLILAEIKGDDLVEKIFECLEAGIEKPADIAELLGMDVSEIYTAQKRLRTKGEKALKKHRQGSSK